MQLYTYEQSARNRSPRGLLEKCTIQLWDLVWTFGCSWTPKPLNAWRIFWLKMFGANIETPVMVHPRARIAMPWNLVMRSGSCIGDRANIYSLAPIEIGRDAVVAQECYLCTGTHDYNERTFPLQVAPILIGDNAFLGARTFVLPGVAIGEGTITGACSLVPKNLESWKIYAGNPCKEIGRRDRSPHA